MTAVALLPVLYLVWHVDCKRHSARWGHTEQSHEGQCAQHSWVSCWRPDSNLMSLGRGPEYWVFYELWVLSLLLVHGLHSQPEQGRGGQTMPMGQIQPQTCFYYFFFKIILALQEDKHAFLFMSCLSPFILSVWSDGDATAPGVQDVKSLVLDKNKNQYIQIMVGS